LIAGVVVLSSDSNPPPGYLSTGNSIFANTNSGYMTRKRDMPTPRSWPAAGVYGPYIFVIGGGSSGNTDPWSVLNQRYDTSRDWWDQMKAMNTPRLAPGAAMYNQYIFVVGGWDSQKSINLKAAEVYDITSNTWNNLPSMQTARGGPAVARVGSLIYVIGGETQTNPALARSGAANDGYYSNTTEVFDLNTGRWLQNIVPNMPVGLVGASAVVVGNKIYVIGGYTYQLDYMPNFVLDRDTNTWQEIAYLNRGVTFEGVTAWNQRIYAFGGFWFNGVRGPIFEYDPVADTWTKLPPKMNQARCALPVSIVGDTAYCIGGATSLNNDAVTGVNESLNLRQCLYYLMRKT
jgi:N-acetylneuraminic acid mutarotase